MRGFSKAIITGNLVRDPELRNTPNGGTVCSFAVAVNRIWKGTNGERHEDVSYFDCDAWGPAAKTINQYARKGSGILVSGRLDQRRWEDKTTGKTRSAVSIVVEDFNFMDSKLANTGEQAIGGQNNESAHVETGVGAGEMEEAPIDIPDGNVDLNDVPF